LHGDEINGTEILRRMIRDKSIIPDAGTVIAMPIVNIYGFLQNTRDLPDGKDLNRSFPGNLSGSLAQRVAYTLMKEIVPLIDYGIDFHTGGASRSNYPQIRCVLDEKNMELGQAFGAPFLMHSSMIDKSFRKAAYKMGKYIMVYEGGESMRFDEFAIQEGIKGTHRVMAHLGMKKKKISEGSSVILRETSWIRAKYAGLFLPLVALGSKVKKGQIIGKLSNPYGESEHRIKANTDGYAIGINYRPVVNGGDALFHIGLDEEMHHRFQGQMPGE
jgi:predicted deacylase